MVILNCLVDIKLSVAKLRLFLSELIFFYYTINSCFSPRCFFVFQRCIYYSWLNQKVLSTRYNVFHIITFPSVNGCQKLFSYIWLTLTIRHRNFILEVSKLLTAETIAGCPHLNNLGDQETKQAIGKNIFKKLIFCKQDERR